jgi:hypothetical protein
MSSWTGSLSLTSSRRMTSFLSARSPSPPSAAPHLPSRTASPPPHPPCPCSTLTRTTPHRAGQYLADPRRYPAGPHVPRAPMQCPHRVRDMPNSGHELPRVSALLCRLVLPRVPPAERRAPCLPRCSHSQALALAPGHQHIEIPARIDTHADNYHPPTRSYTPAQANMTFAVKDSIGCLPPPQGIQLYMARIDPHLTFGCEVALDVTQAHVSKLEDVQHEYLRQLLGLNRRSVIAILFSETGIIPLRCRLSSSLDVACTNPSRWRRLLRLRPDHP